MRTSTGTQLIHINLVAPPPPSADARAGHPVTKIAGADSTIITSFRIFSLLPIRAQWISRITEFEWNHHFCDVQDKGPFKAWHHRHQFAREMRSGVDGTLVSDAVEYEVGFGLLGEIANRLFVARQLSSTFAHRQQVLPQLLS